MKPLLATLRRLKPQGSHRNMRLCVTAILIGVLVAIVGPSEVSFRTLRYALRSHPASGRLVIVDFDDRLLAMVGKWPIPRDVFARTIDRLFALGAKRVFFNVDFSSAQDPTQDKRLADAIGRHAPRVYLASRVVAMENSSNVTVLTPSRTVRGDAPVVNISFKYSGAGHAFRLPYSVALNGSAYQGLAAAMADHAGTTPGEFAIDPTLDLHSIARFSMADILANRVSQGIAGKDVLIGSTSIQLQDYYDVSPFGFLSATYFHAVGAETLREGAPRDFGPVPALWLASVIVFAVTGRRRRWALPVSLAAAIGLPFLLVPLPGRMTMSVMPGMATLLLVSAVEIVRLARDTLKRREQTNRLSGLLNLTALRQLSDQPDDRLVVAHFHNFAEALATLPVNGEAAFIAQISARLKLGMGDAQLYHGDNGVFAWMARESVDELGERLDGLHALFRSAVTVGEAALDLTLTFGIDDDGSRSVANRLGSALVAAAEAMAEGGRWRAFDKSKLADAAWKLSLLSQLDAAIDDGHLWVAYQPKLDLATNRLIGAEALVRWTHPEKGAISPIEFVQAAEQSNRIERLTSHVLERAVLAAATINAHDIRFEISVNLSARLLENHDIVPRVVEALATNRLAPELLTLEVTETATIAGGQSLDVLHELRALGVRISIDDYGTGLSTLEYLKKVPASEIKIDKVFVQSMMTSTSDLLMVNSTIQLAHSLGHIVVAEGIETDDVLARLREMGCDIAQGYRIGRPMTFQDLARRLLAERKHAA